MKLSDYQRELGDVGIKLFQEWRELYSISDEKELFLLGIIAESWETIMNSRKIIKDQGSSIRGAYGLEPHPEIAIAREATERAFAAIRQLNLGAMKITPNDNTKRLSKRLGKGHWVPSSIEKLPIR